MPDDFWPRCQYCIQWGRPALFCDRESVIRRTVRTESGTERLEHLCSDHHFGVRHDDIVRATREEAA